MHGFRIVLFPTLALALSGLACGNSSQTNSGSTTTGTGGSGSSSSAGATTSASSSGGTGGATSGSSAASSGGTGGQGTGGAAACVGSIDLAIDNKALQHFTYECNGDFDANQWTTPVGYLFAGNLPGAPSGVRIVGCNTTAAKSEGVVLSALDANGAGTYTMGTPQYTDSSGTVFGSGADPFNMVITSFGGAGQPIDGTFTATSNSGSVGHTLQGSFHVCHGNDFLPP